MKKLFFTGIVLLFSLPSFCQYAREDAPDTNYKRPLPPPQRAPFWDHVSIGGGFGLQLGDLTYVALSPLLSYHVTNDLVIGAGPMYQYFSYSDGGGTYTNNIYGGRMDIFYFLPGRLNDVFLQGEYEILNVPDDYSIFANVTRATIYVPIAGIGIRRQIGERSYYTLSLLWDFSQSALSPYANPIVNAGVDFGI